MIRKTLNPFTANCFPSLQNKSAFNFVKQKQIDEISAKYGQGKWQKIKMYGQIFKHIGLQGFKGFRSDFKIFRQLRVKQNLSEELKAQKMRIYGDIFKMGPLIIIQILPFSGPLFMLYMYTYPGSIPSWFLIDYYHDRHEQLKVKNQKKSIQYFKQKQITAKNINLSTISLRQLRKLSLMMFGFYRDGTIGYRKLLNKRIDHLFSESLSKVLIKRQLKKRFERDLFSNSITNKMSSLQQMVQWKFDKIMSGQDRMIYSPLYQKAEQKMLQNQGKQAKIFEDIQKDDQEQQKKNQKNQNTKK